jgi:hypothetical protein
MAVTILDPRSGDTVSSPVTVTSGYDFSAATTLTSSVGSSSDGGKSLPASQGVSGSDPIPVGNGTYTVSGQTNNGGGSDSQPNVTVGNPPVLIAGFEEMALAGTAAAAPSVKKKYKVKGKFKNQTPAITKVVAKAYKVTVASQTFDEKDSGEDPSPNGSNFTWKVELEFDREAGFPYVIRAFAYANTTLVASTSKHLDK